MARRTHDDRQTPQEDLTPVYDDLIYDGLDSIRRYLPRDKAEAEAEDGDSDTPERALSKLAAEMNPDGDEDEEDDAAPRRRKKKERPPVEEKRERKQVPARLRKVVLVLITLVILLTLVLMLLARIMPDVTWLQAPEGAVSQAVTPVQSVFSNITESITGYLRKLKLRSNLEEEYNKLRA